jgi:D-alanyl-D-alanine carboxypeptidase/D-alanyl-D-alanine-endopeptidase (penicillin-binding protein 4)
MRWCRRLLPLLLTAAMLAPVAQGTPLARAQRGAPRTVLTPDWRRQIDALVGDQPVSVEIGYAGDVLYHHLEWVRRTPASNEKLLVSMALLDRVDPDVTIPTRVLTGTSPVNGVVDGNLWLVGHGDPETGKPDMAALADALKTAGITRVRGSVIASTGPFARDWWAKGWRWYFPLYYMPLPTALTFDGNTRRGHPNPRDPELGAAVSLTHKLRERGVVVHGPPRTGRPSTALTVLATVQSPTLRSILHRMDLWSVNFYAEVLNKYLGAVKFGLPGTIAKGTAAVRAFAAAHGVHGIVVNDGSGLSYANRVSASDIVRLLWAADAAPWGVTLRNLLATGGHGTLIGRLERVPVHAKTGTLIDISALSGWVWLNKVGAWAEFSILSRGMSKGRSVHIENTIVRLVSEDADPAA